MSNFASPVTNVGKVNMLNAPTMSTLYMHIWFWISVELTFNEQKRS